MRGEWCIGNEPGQQEDGELAACWRLFRCGKILKSNVARALRRATLMKEERIRRRIVSMMLAGNVPHEFREYKKLLRGLAWVLFGQSSMPRSIDRIHMKCAITITWIDMRVIRTKAR